MKNITPISSKSLRKERRIKLLKQTLKGIGIFLALVGVIGIFWVMQVVIYFLATPLVK